MQGLGFAIIGSINRVTGTGPYSTSTVTIRKKVFVFALSCAWFAMVLQAAVVLRLLHLI